MHDLIEIYAGDTFAYDPKGHRDKYEREAAAADRLFSLLPEDQGKEFRSLWKEFDAMETPEAQYAASIDRFQPFLHNYRTQGYTWKEGKVHYAQVYERMEILRTAMPALWPTVLNMMKDSVEKGYSSPNTLMLLFIHLYPAFKLPDGQKCPQAVFILLLLFS